MNASHSSPMNMSHSVGSLGGVDVDALVQRPSWYSGAPTEHIHSAIVRDELLDAIASLDLARIQDLARRMRNRGMAREHGAASSVLTLLGPQHARRREMMEGKGISPSRAGYGYGDDDAGGNGGGDNGGDDSGYDDDAGSDAVRRAEAAAASAAKAAAAAITAAAAAMAATKATNVANAEGSAAAAAADAAAADAADDADADVNVNVNAAEPPPSPDKPCLQCQGERERCEASEEASRRTQLEAQERLDEATRLGEEQQIAMEVLQREADEARRRHEEQGRALEHEKRARGEGDAALEAEQARSMSGEIDLAATRKEHTSMGRALTLMQAEKERLAEELVEAEAVFRRLTQVRIRVHHIQFSLRRWEVELVWCVPATELKTGSRPMHHTLSTYSASTLYTIHHIQLSDGLTHTCMA